MRVSTVLLLGLLALLVGMPLAGAEQGAALVWYRSSEGCPDGAAFVARLAELGQAVRLAKVGDRVDFVVTLGHGSTESSGRLERQTSTGTVAVREYRDGSCEEVAEALALTLELALAPDDASPAERLDADEPGPPLVHPSETIVRDRGVEAAAPTPTTLAATQYVLGARAHLVVGIAQRPLLGGALFAGAEDPGWIVPALRGTLFAAHATGDEDRQGIGVSIVGARFEGCPLQWRTEPIGFAFCTAAEAGVLRGRGAESGAVSDAGIWAALSGLGRASVGLGMAVSLEGQLGVSVPLVRYAMGPVDGSGVWFRTGAVGAEAGVGLAWQMP